MESTTAAGRLRPARDQQRENLPSQTGEFSNTNDDVQESIAKLAHALWQNRGCPEGSAEQDWIDAEKQLTTSQTQAATAGQ